MFISFKTLPTVLQEQTDNITDNIFHFQIGDSVEGTAQFMVYGSHSHITDWSYPENYAWIYVLANGLSLV